MYIKGESSPVSGVPARSQPRVISAPTPSPVSGDTYPPHRLQEVLLRVEDDLVRATAGLVKKGLVAFRYPTFQVLSLPKAETKSGALA